MVGLTTTSKTGLDVQGGQHGPGVGTGSALALDCLLAIGLGLALASLLLIGHPHAYYTDDYQTQFMPTYYSIGTTLWNDWQVPFLTLKSWVGGNLLGEYQYALLNPVALLLFACLPFFSSLPAGAAFISIVLTGLFAGGGFFFARTVGVSRALSFVAAILFATNSYIFYWYASSWIPGLMSFAFLPWAMAFILRSERERWSYFGAGVFTALTATAGWPHTLLVLGVFVAIVCAVRMVQGAWREMLGPASAALFGCLTGAMAIVPTLSLSQVASRDLGTFNNGFLVPELADVLSVSHPFHLGWMSFFPGYALVGSPIFYVAWFILPTLVLLDWGKVRWGARDLVVLLTFACLLLVATQGPEHLGPLRWPFRYLVYFHIALVSALLLMLTQAGFVFSRRRVLIAAGAVCLSGVIALQKNPLDYGNILIATAAMLVATAILAALAPARHWLLALFLALTSIGFWAALHRVIPNNPNLADLEFARTPSKSVSLLEAPKASTLMLSGWSAGEPAERFEEFVFGQMGLAVGEATVNGYTPIGHLALSPRFCLASRGYVCPDAGRRLFEREPSTGQTFADLMRINEIVAVRGAYLNKVRSFLSPPWQLARAGKYAIAFTRNLPNGGLPGTLSYPREGISVEPLGPATATSERLRVVRRQEGHDLLVFARTWWPDYRAKLNGRRVSVVPVAGFLVGVVLPADGEVGELSLTWRPPRMELSIGASLFGLAALLVGTIFFGFFRRLVFGYG